MVDPCPIFSVGLLHCPGSWVNPNAVDWGKSDVRCLYHSSLGGISGMAKALKWSQFSKHRELFHLSGIFFSLTFLLSFPAEQQNFWMDATWEHFHAVLLKNYHKIWKHQSQHMIYIYLQNQNYYIQILGTVVIEHRQPALCVCVFFFYYYSRGDRPWGTSF